MKHLLHCWTLHVVSLRGLCWDHCFFFIYINDLPNISDILTFFLFADDTNIYLEAKSLHILENIINKELKKLYLWLNINRLALNVEKTNYIIFHPYNKPAKAQTTIKINNKAIKETVYIKYFGILIDYTLSWKAHIHTISKKIPRSIGIMHKLKPYLPSKVMKDVYYSLVFSQIVYGIEVWGSAFKTEVDKILILQKRVLRLITYDNYPNNIGPLRPTDPLFYNLKILMISDMYKYQIAKFVYKSINRHQIIFMIGFIVILIHIAIEQGLILTYRIMKPNLIYFTLYENK